MFQWDNNFSFIFTNFICIIPFFTITNVISISFNTCPIFKRLRIGRNRITWFISIIIPQTACLLYSSKLYTGITTSKSSALSIFMALIFEVQLINGAFFFRNQLFFHQTHYYLHYQQQLHQLLYYWVLQNHQQ